MKALTLYQPWATLLAEGHKKNETRPRRILYEGPVAIHASKRAPVRKEVQPMMRSLRRVWNVMDHISDDLVFAKVEGLTRGAVIAVAGFGKSQPTEAFVSADRIEFDFGNYQPGRFFMPVIGLVRLPDPIPARGMQGLWDFWPEGIGQSDTLMDAVDQHLELYQVPATGEEGAAKA